MSKLLTLTPTRAQLGARCHRRHVLTDIASLVSNDHPNALKHRSNVHAAFGSVIHAGVGAFWKAKQAEAIGRMTLEELLGIPQTQARAAIETSWLQEFSSDTKDYSLELALAMIDGYARNAELAPLVPGEWAVKSIEERLLIPIGPYQCSFMMDRWLFDSSGQGRYLFVDTKTTKSLRAGWSKNYDVSLQMKLYKYAIWKLTGTVPDGIIEGLEKKVPSRIEYHLLPNWDDSILDEAAKQFIHIASLDEAILQAATSNGVLDVERLWELAATETSFNDNDCFAYGQACPFLPVCSAPTNERLAILKGEFKYEQPDWTE